MVKHETVCEFREVECQNAEWGCQVTCSHRKLIQHVDTCLYKPVPCPVPDCVHKVPQKLLMKHLSQQHRVKQEGFLELGTVNSLLMLVLVISVAFNFSFLYS